LVSWLLLVRAYSPVENCSRRDFREKYPRKTGCFFLRTKAPFQEGQLLEALYIKKEVNYH